MKTHFSLALFLFFFSNIATLNAAEAPVACFDAAKSAPTAQGWSDHHDRPGEAVMRHEEKVLRIEDDDDRGEDRFFHFSLTDEHRAIARETGFTATWRLRIPHETGLITRAISTEFCVGDGAENLRLCLQMGRRGNELLAGIHTGSGDELVAALTVADGSPFNDWTIFIDGKRQ